MRSVILAATLVIYAPTSQAFFESLGASIAGSAVWEYVTGQDPYRPLDWEDPVEEVRLDEQVSRHCDPYGGCTDYVSTTVIRKVREYRYDWDPRWEEWAINDYN